jgi:hypothetical protein
LREGDTMTDDRWAEEGDDDDLAGEATIPAFIEVAPQSYKPVQECTASELRAAADSMLLQARSLMDEARRLYERAEAMDT